MLKPSYAVWLCFEFCQNSLTLVRDLSYSHDQDHIHVHSQIASISIHSQNKTPSSIMTLSPRLPSRIWAIQKEIKDAYPKKVCHMPKRHKKKECQEKRKDAYPKKVCHMSTRHVEKKEEKKKKYSPCPRKKYKEERWIIRRSSSTIHQKYSTHLHLLIRLYDSFLLGSYFWLNNISKANMPLYSYPKLHISLIRW